MVHGYAAFNHNPRTLAIKGSSFTFAQLTIGHYVIMGGSFGEVEVTNRALLLRQGALSGDVQDGLPSSVIRP